MVLTLICKEFVLLIYSISVDDILVDQRIWDIENNKSENYGNSKGKRLEDTRVQGSQGKPQ